MPPDPLWRAALGRLGLAWAGLFVLFFSDFSAMAGQWWNSSTYNHQLLIPPIIAGLVWRRWPQLRGLEPRAWWPGLLGIIASGILWLLGAVVGVDLLRQAGAVALLGATVPLVLGPQVATGAIFPIFYSIFLVPFGDELVTLLQTLTAQLAVALTRASGIPVRVDGVFLDTPAGLFEVAEACSGVKFLVAMVALGVLVCHLCYRSWARRALFMAACVVVPVLANAVRAWGTILAAQYVGAARAGGFDHIVYGWVFFAAVIAAVLGLAWRSFDRPFDDPAIDDAKLARIRASAAHPLGTLLAGALVVAGAAGWAQAAQRLAAPLPARIDLPAVAGWSRTDHAPAAPWRPLAGGADHRLLGSYRDAAGRRIDVFVALYAGQDAARDPAGFGQGALPMGSDWAWGGPATGSAGARCETLRWRGRHERTACTWYRAGSVLTGSPARLKLATLGQRLTLRARPAALLIVSAEPEPGSDPAAAIAAFAAAIGDPGAWLDRLAQPG